MLKTASAVDLAVRVDHKEQNGKGIQVENWDEKEPIQKSRKSQQTAKSKKWIQAEKSEATRAKNFSSQSASKQERLLSNLGKHLSKRQH